MKFDLSTIDWTAIASIATIFTIIFLVLNLKEMRRQRKSIYLPKICIPNDKFYIGNNSINIPNVWTRLSDGKKEDFIPKFDIKLINVGLAAAINISVSWKINIKKIKADLEIMIGDEKSKIIKVKAKTSNQYFYESSIPSQYGFIIENKIHKEIIPVIQKESSLDLKIPELITNYISYYIYERFRISNDDRRNEVFPYPITVIIEYYDIGNNKIIQLNEIEFEFVFLKKPFLKNHICYGDIIIKEKKRLTTASTL